MKVYQAPDEVPSPSISLLVSSNTNKPYEKACDDHREALKNWLKKSGYAGANTGKVVRFPVADGYAEYMLAEGKTSCLIHLDYYDGYRYPDVKFLPKKEILARIQQEENMAKLFASKR